MLSLISTNRRRNFIKRSRLGIESFAVAVVLVEQPWKGTDFPRTGRAAKALRTDTKRLELHAEKYLDKRKKEDKNEEEIISMPVKKPWDKQREMANSLKLRMCQFCHYLSTSRQDSPISISLNIGRN